MPRLASLSLLLPLLLAAGCLGTAQAPRRYTVADPAPDRRPWGPDLTVRTAPDLRAATAPLLFRADGSVATLRALTYYASLEVAIDRAIRESMTPPPNGETRLLVRDFCVDERGDAPVARVTIEGPRGAKTATEPLPPAAPPEQIRAALARCLQTAYSQATTAQTE